MRYTLAAALVGATLMAGTAQAAVPVFAATCGNRVNIDTDTEGVLRVAGDRTRLRKINADSYEATHAKVRYSIVRSGREVMVSFTGPGRANGVCEVRLPQTAAGPAAAPTAAVAATGRPSHSERAGQGQFDARATIPCAQAKGQPMGQCPMAVARDPGGSATVVVTRPDGRTRAIFFEKGRAVSADLSQADGNMRFHATKEADLFKIEAGNERYEIPEAAVFGG